MVQALQSDAKNVTIVRWADLADRDRYTEPLNDIFFESSATKSFASSGDRQSFRERWLGRYLEHDPEWAYLALGPDGALAGYLVGSVDDPVRTPRFADIAAFEEFAALTPRYPAHLHVNLGPAWRSHGIGTQLIECFGRDAGRAGAAGMHVITSAGSRNVRFYERNGFREVGRVSIDVHVLVFLGRRLASPETA